MYFVFILFPPASSSQTIPTSPAPQFYVFLSFFYITHWVQLVLPTCEWVRSHPLGHSTPAATPYQQPRPWRELILPSPEAIICQSPSPTYAGLLADLTIEAIHIPKHCYWLPQGHFWVCLPWIKRRNGGREGGGREGRKGRINHDNLNFPGK